jgi:hypothetical protein
LRGFAADGCGGLFLFGFSMSAPRIRPAAISDIDALDAIERSVFVSDRISRRSFRTLIDRPTAETIVIEADGRSAAMQ